MCCTRLAGNAGCKKSPKIRHLGTIAQPCWAISSQLRHVLTIGKKLVKQQYCPHMSSQYGELCPTIGWYLLAADFSSFIVEIVQKTTNLGMLSPFWGSYGRRGTLVDGSLESPCRLLINCNWTSFSISYRWRAIRQNVSKLTAFWREWVSLCQDFREGSSLGNIFWFLEN